MLVPSVSKESRSAWTVTTFCRSSRTFKQPLIGPRDFPSRSGPSPSTACGLMRSANCFEPTTRRPWKRSSDARRRCGKKHGRKHTVRSRFFSATSRSGSCVQASDRRAKTAGDSAKACASVKRPRGERPAIRALTPPELRISTCPAV